ncbi:hypothetical protein H2Y59_21755 [Pectobacterium aroidearum]|uniref:hypothetical protein n=1 Tax=Pectobacterium aroidearum TaxID=1201031 RepID=UPI0015F5E349|nr:hypothetical protein [Pectobacterium aroidearum]MBA5739918.1 hypothetical protein [Pectobacterium aroidearum]
MSMFVPAKKNPAEAGLMMVFWGRGPIGFIRAESFYLSEMLKAAGGLTLRLYLRIRHYAKKMRANSKTATHAFRVMSSFSITILIRFSPVGERDSRSSPVRCLSDRFTQR